MSCDHNGPVAVLAMLRLMFPSLRLDGNESSAIACGTLTDVENDFRRFHFFIDKSIATRL